MKKILLLLIFFIFCLSVIVIVLKEDSKEEITYENIRSEYLLSDVTILIDSSFINESEKEVNFIFYIFGDFFFNAFSNELEKIILENYNINNYVLIGINEIAGKAIDVYQQQYIRFITEELLDYLAKKYSIGNKSILFGHSRATRLVTEILFIHPEPITHYVLSAPWMTEENLSNMDFFLEKNKTIFSLYITQSEEDMKRKQNKKANEALLKLLETYSDSIKYEYMYFDGETHMSIPPMSFYFGLKYLIHL